MKSAIICELVAEQIFRSKPAYIDAHSQRDKRQQYIGGELVEEIKNRHAQDREVFQAAERERTKRTQHKQGQQDNQCGLTSAPLKTVLQRSDGYLGYGYRRRQCSHKKQEEEER